MKPLLIFLILCLFGLQVQGFLYPEYRRVLPGSILYKYKYCPHDCWSWPFLNQYDAYRCPKACQTW